MCVPTAARRRVTRFSLQAIENNMISLSTASRRRYPPCGSLILLRMIFLNIQVKYIILKTCRLGQGNLPIGAGKPADSTDAVMSGGMSMPMKLSAESFVQAYINKGYRESTNHNLKAIYDQIETNQVFGSAYLMKILECSERTARVLVAKLREMDVVVPVSGKGKGMYRLKNAGEE